MKLHEIIKVMEKPRNSVLIELLVPYKNSLLTYYQNYFCDEPILMVTMVANAVQYARIEPAGELREAVNAWIEDAEYEDEKDKEREVETILFNSISLSRL